MRSALILIIVTVSAAAAFGQICPGSDLTYIVRDSKGVAIDAAGNDITFEENNGTKFSKWKVTSKEFVRHRIKAVPDNITALKGKVSGLQTSGMCNFSGPVTLKLTIKGKVMELTFNPPKMGEYDSSDFLVDSMPFRKGRFEITLEADPNRASLYYAAAGWKKVK
ncbi:MAG: hypothetical protein ABL952_06035 [Pyrinomonadaceae bacterium]